MEDLLQEAFVEVFRSLSSFRGEASLGTWIDRVTARVAYGYLARRKAERARGITAGLHLVPDAPSDDASAEDRALAREAGRALYAILDKLDPTLRIAFTLHVLDGRPVKDVADVMDASVVATKVRIWRARREVERRARGSSVLAELVVERDEDAPDDASERGGEP